MPRGNIAPEYRCIGTRKNGDPCRAPKVLSTDYCHAHSTSVSADQRFGSPAQARVAAQASAEARWTPKLAEVVRARLEAEAERIAGAAIAALDATVMIVDKDGGEHVHEDGRTRLAAAVALMDRGLGRPGTTVSANVDVRSVAVSIDATDPQARQALADVLRSRPAAPR